MFPGVMHIEMFKWHSTKHTKTWMYINVYQAHIHYFYVASSLDNWIW